MPIQATSKIWMDGEYVDWDAARRVSEAVAAEVASRTPGAPLRTADVGDRIAASATA